MKKILLLLSLLAFQLSDAAWITSFEQAQKMALESNKLMIVDFWATWCGPCKRMDAESWNSSKVDLVLQDYIQVKVDIDADKAVANRYGINSIPHMFIMDANGKVVYKFSGYHDAEALKRELDKFALNTEFLTAELANYFKTKNYNSALRVSQKYFDYSMFVEKEIKSDIINTADDYLADAKKNLSKTDADYAEKKQKLELLSLYRIAYAGSYSKLEKKVNEIKEADITENNKNQYYFLKYLAYKGNKNQGFASVEATVAAIDGFDSYIKKADMIIAKSS